LPRGAAVWVVVVGVEVMVLPEVVAVWVSAATLSLVVALVVVVVVVVAVAFSMSFVTAPNNDLRGLVNTLIRPVRPPCEGASPDVTLLLVLVLLCVTLVVVTEVSVGVLVVVVVVVVEGTAGSFLIGCASPPGKVVPEGRGRVGVDCDCRSLPPS